MGQATVRTTAGEVRGAELDRVAVFKGLPYAAAPVGARRFRPPAPPEPWSGVREALDYAPSCPQVPERPADWPDEHAEDEDCLALNVWTPAADDGRRPVLVWVHGGGFTIGSGSWPLYDGTALARRGDVVVVTVNHRLGVLGYLHLGELGGPELASSGNAGQLDLVAALEWVRDNIAAFGGDAGNVTVFGESGGGAKISTLLAMPAATGLYHRAVVQSGPRLKVQTVPEATAVAEQVLAELGVGADDLDALADLPVDRLVEAERAVIARHGGVGFRGFNPVLDGIAVPLHPADALASGTAPDVPLLVGTTRDEATFFLARDPVSADPGSLDEAGLTGRLATLGDHAGPVLAAYRAVRPDDTRFDLLVAVQSDERMRVPSIRLAERRLSHGGAPVFMYLFSWAAGPMRAAHGFELPFVFDNARPPVMKSSASRDELAAQMSEAWLAFARTGDPSHPGLPEWPAYTTDDRATMVFDRGACQLERDPFGAERQAWEAVEL